MKLRRLGILPLLLALTFVSALQAKEPWKWSTADRLGARISSELSQKRITEYAARHGGASIPKNVIEGKVNPELILPSEAFRQFIGITFVADEAITSLKRAAIKKTSLDILKTDEEWARLEQDVADFVAQLRRYETLASEASQVSGDRNTEIKSEMTQLQKTLCTSGRRALDAAYSSFGQSEFDRLLYLQIVPNMNLVWFSDAPRDLNAEIAKEIRCAGL
jgi:hypothetical protein